MLSRATTRMLSFAVLVMLMVFLFRLSTLGSIGRIAALGMFLYFCLSFSPEVIDWLLLRLKERSRHP